MKRKYLLLTFSMVIVLGFTTVVSDAYAATEVIAPEASEDDLPETGWEITQYICDFEGCHTDPNGDPNFWPIHFRLAVDGWAVKVKCLDQLTPLPPLGTKCTRDGNKFTCDSPPGTQDDFELVEIIEEPPEPTPTPPPPELESFTVDISCADPGRHSNDLKLVVKALDDNGNPFAGAQVEYSVEGGPGDGGQTGGNGVFSDTIAGARDFIGKTLTVEVGDLDPKQIEITNEVFAPCTARCDSLTGAYDAASDSVALTVSGDPPGFDAVIWNVTKGNRIEIASGKLNENGELTGVDDSVFWGKNLYEAQAGGESGPKCTFEVDTPFPAKLIVYGDCTPHGQDSDILVLSGEMRDQDDKLFVKPLTLTMILPDPEKTSVTIELVDGKFGPIEVPGAKTWTGNDVVFNWAEGGNKTFTITAEIFLPCRTPTPTPTPTSTPTPTRTQEPRNGPEEDEKSLRGERLARLESRQLKQTAAVVNAAVWSVWSFVRLVAVVMIFGVLSFIAWKNQGS